MMKDVTEPSSSRARVTCVRRPLVMATLAVERIVGTLVSLVEATITPPPLVVVATGAAGGGSPLWSIV